MHIHEYLDDSHNRWTTLYRNMQPIAHAYLMQWLTRSVGRDAQNSLHTDEITAMDDAMLSHWLYN